MTTNNLDWLDEVVTCPWCKHPVKQGDRIWLDGEALCPQCYEHKLRKYSNLKRRNDS